MAVHVRIAHIGLHAADLDGVAAIHDLVIAAGASDRVATNGRTLGISCRDPDGTEGEVLVADPTSTPTTSGSALGRRSSADRASLRGRPRPRVR